VRLYFRHCKVQINKDYKVTHYTPFPLFKPPQKNCLITQKRKERERKKNLQKHEKLTRTTKYIQKNKNKKSYKPSKRKIHVAT